MSKEIPIQTIDFGGNSSLVVESISDNKYLNVDNEKLKTTLDVLTMEIDNIKSYLSGEPPYNGYGDPKNIFSFIDPSFIHKNLLGSRLISIFRKK